MQIYSLRAETPAMASAVRALLDQFGPKWRVTVAAPASPGQLDVEFSTDMHFTQVRLLIGQVPGGLAMLQTLRPAPAAGNSFELDPMTGVPRKARFGAMLSGQDFLLRDVAGNVWRRTQGRFAIRVDLIGEGRGAFPLDFDESVTPLEQPAVVDLEASLESGASLLGIDRGGQEALSTDLPRG